MPSPFASYLRVYEPLAAFDRERQRYWRRYYLDGRAVAPPEGVVRQRTTVLEALGANWNRLPDLPDDGYVIETDETLLICPWNLRIRVAEAALTARSEVPSALADAFVPAVFVGLAQTVMDDWRSGSRVLERGLPRLHERTATWMLPLRWFAFFGPEERVLSLSHDKRSLCYRTQISKALRRGQRARSVLRRSVGEVPMGHAIEETHRWLEEFHPYSILELDYGGLVGLLSDETLMADDSSGLVAEAITALASGQTRVATTAYDRLSDRWRRVQLLERSN